MKRLRILQIFSRYLEYGGEEGSVFRIGDALQKHHEVEYYIGSTEELLGARKALSFFAPFRAWYNQFSAKAKGLTIVGSLGLLITTILTMVVIERAFNEIWRVSERRPFLKKLAIYLAATIIGPILLGLGIYLSSVLLGSASGWFPNLSAGFKFISTIIPSLLALIVFALAYRILPYAPVSWRDAFIGAAFVAVAYEITKFGFAYFMTQTAFYKTVYGTFAILPLMLIWIYITWWLTLAGAVIVANLPTIRQNRPPELASA